MEKLVTIQTKEKLNDVYATDEKGNGGANHNYLISIDRGLQVPIEVEIQMQDGARKNKDAIHGIIDTDLLEIVRHRLQCFQNGAFASEYNEHALNHIEEALHCMNARIEDRINRSVLGTDCK